MGIRSDLYDMLHVDLACCVGSRALDITGNGGDICPVPDATPREVAASQLLKSFFKKFQDDIDQETADAEAFKVFYAMNARCAEWRLRTEELGPYDEVLLGEFRQTLWDFFNPEGMPLLSQSSIERGVDFGPGSAPGCILNTWPEKIGSSKMTAPNQLTVDLFYQWVESHPTRVDCEIARILSMGRPEVDEVVKITPVPKTAKISRLVKPEPLLGMFFQKGIQSALEHRLHSFFGIDLETQPSINAELARIGSLNRAYATIDLTSASDCISMAFCDAYLPKGALTWLKAFRCKTAEAQGQNVELHMIATMGNAFCFPLQTAIFASAVVATYRTLGLPLRNGLQRRVTYENTSEATHLHQHVVYPNWGTFGDDIIVLEEAYPTIVRLLKALGFIPNQEKSFSRDSGFFRESCGSDFFRGQNVRGVYCKSLKRVQDKYVLINNLVDWSAKTKIPLTRTIAYLTSRVKRIEVPPWENPDSGIRMPLDCVKSQDVRICRSSDDTQKPNYLGSYLYKRWVPRDCSEYVDGLERKGRSKGESRLYWNSSAIFLSAMKGMLRGGKVSIRLYETNYRLRFGVAPCWDHIVPGDRRFASRSCWYSMARVFFQEEEPT